MRVLHKKIKCLDFSPTKIKFKQKLNLKKTLRIDITRDSVKHQEYHFKTYFFTEKGNSDILHSK